MLDMDQINGLPAALAEKYSEDNPPPGGGMFRGAIFGLRLSNLSTAPDTTINIALGKCRDIDDTMDMVFGAGMTKRLDQPWAAGTGAGARDVAGALGLEQGYHIYLIYNPTTQVYDILASTSATNPAMPAGFTKKRRLGAVVTDNAGKIQLFEQIGDEFWLLKRGADVEGQPQDTIPILRRLKMVPQGKKMKAFVHISVQYGGATAGYFNVSDPELGGIPGYTTGAARPYGVYVVANTAPFVTDRLEVWTDTAGYVYTYATISGMMIAVFTLGWMDDRDKEKYP